MRANTIQHYFAMASPHFPNRLFSLQQWPPAICTTTLTVPASCDICLPYWPLILPQSSLPHYKEIWVIFINFILQLCSLNLPNSSIFLQTDTKALPQTFTHWKCQANDLSTCNLPVFAGLLLASLLSLFQSPDHFKDFGDKLPNLPFQIYTCLFPNNHQNCNETVWSFKWPFICSISVPFDHKSGSRSHALLYQYSCNTSTLQAFKG